MAGSPPKTVLIRNTIALVDIFVGDPCTIVEAGKKVGLRQSAIYNYLRIFTEFFHVSVSGEGVRGSPRRFMILGGKKIKPRPGYHFSNIRNTLALINVCSQDVPSTILQASKQTGISLCIIYCYIRVFMDIFAMHIGGRGRRGSPRKFRILRQK